MNLEPMAVTWWSRFYQQETEMTEATQAILVAVHVKRTAHAELTIQISRFLVQILEDNLKSTPIPTDGSFIEHHCLHTVGLGW